MKIAFIVGLICAISWSKTETSAAVIRPNIIKPSDHFPVSIIHINDFHSRFEETSDEGARCVEGDKCIGGYARAVTVIKQLKELHKETNPIYLNAGDNFQGTLWYTLGRWNVTSHFLNLLKADVITLGNHEFDNGIAGLVPFLNALESPVVIANMDDSEEPTIQGKTTKSIIIDRFDRKIGIIGAIIASVPNIGRTEKLHFFNESKAIRKEAEKLNNQGVDIIIVLSHCGLETDYVIAKNAGPHIDVIVGGHSHTFMYTVPENGSSPGPSVPQDNYPAVVTHEDGHRVLIVQASVYMKYVGDLTVYFDKNGKVAHWEGAPIFLDTDVVPDPEIVRELIPWREIINAKGKEIVGMSGVMLQETTCNRKECNLGNVIADSFVHYYATTLSDDSDEEWSSSYIAIIPTGNIRTSINAGPITYYDVASTCPFEEYVNICEIRGDYIKDMFEHAVSSPSHGNEFVGPWLTQVSGAKVVYNTTNEIQNRVVSIDVLNTNATAPKYVPLDPTKYYRLIAQGFFLDGGDEFSMLLKNKRNQRVGPLDQQVLMKYFQDMKVINTGLENRLTFLK